MNRFSLIFTAIFLILHLVHCTKETDTKGNYSNPNGQSELAGLMREMVSDFEAMKSDVEQNKKPRVENLYKSLMDAEATDPKMVSDPSYPAHAKSFEESVRRLREVSLDQLHSTYNEVIQNCMNCHMSACPGPMVQIEKLYVE